MSARKTFVYAQARVQARHGERATVDLWNELHASHDLGHFLQVARDTPLGAWIGHLDRDHGPDAVDRSLRRRFREHVTEVADWVPAAWAPAVLWVTWIPDLARLDGLRDASPAALHDASDTERRPDPAPLLQGASDETVGERWSRHYRASWPATSRAERRSLEALDGLVGRHLETMRESDVEGDGWKLRETLAQELVRHFRRHAGGPSAVFAHLALTALDLERLRGAMLRRAALPNVWSDAAWV